MRIDKANQRFLDYQNAKVGDVNGRELLVQITNNGVVEDQTGTTLKLNWQHENGNQDSTNFKVVDIKTGKYSLYYPKEMLYKGTVDASVEINSNGQITHTMNFKIIVHGDVFNGEAGTVNGVFISLADVNKKLDDREKEYVELKERQTSVETQFNDIQQELTDKDIVSAPEIIEARNGEVDLKARLDKDQQEVTAQLAQKPSQAELYSNITTPKAMSLSQSPNKKPFISFVDDDGYKKAYSLLAPMLEQKGMVGNLAITVSLVGESNRVTTADLLDLQDRGFEIASHNYTDVYFESANLTPEEIENEMRMTKETLNSWGIQVDNHVYTGGQMAGNIGRSIVKKYFKAGYGAGEGTHSSQNNVILDEMSINRISIDVPSLAHLKAQVDRCVAENNWLIFMGHCNTWDATRIQIVNDLLDYVATQNVTVGTLSEGYDIFGNSFAIGHDNYIKLLNNGEIYSNAIGSVFNDSALKNITLDTKLNEFAENKITYTNVFANRSVALGLPETDDGLLVTTRSNQTYSSRQRWQPQVSGNVYERTWKGTIMQGSWNPFKGVGLHTVTNLPSAHNQDDLQGQLIVSKIDSGGNAGYPSNGLNITFNSSAGWIKQIFSGLNNNKLFLRTFKSDGSKTEWTEYAPAPLKKSVVIPSTVYSENETKVIDIDLLDLMDLSGYTAAQRNRIPLIATCRSASVDNYSYNIRLTNEGIAKLRVTNLGAAKTFPASDWDITIFGV